jgi:hypothetical protein
MLSKSIPDLAPEAGVVKTRALAEPCVISTVEEVDVLATWLPAISAEKLNR